MPWNEHRLQTNLWTPRKDSDPFRPLALFLPPLTPLHIRKDSGLTAWPAPGGHSCGPGQLPVSSPIGAGQAKAWFGGSEVHCRGRRSSPAGGEVKEGVPLILFLLPGMPSAPASLPTFAFCPTPMNPSRLGSMPLPGGRLWDFPRWIHPFPPLDFHSTLFIP